MALIDLRQIERDVDDLEHRWAGRDGAWLRPGGPVRRLLAYVRQLIAALRDERGQT